jgi:TolB-like protein
VPRYLGLVLIAFFGLPLLAATPSSTLLTKPNVIVYPFVPTGSSIDREAGSRLATILAQQMSDTGRVTVIAPPPGTERADYLKVALANNADYYVTGYVTPLGDAVAVVEQVVSTTTGIVVFSQTAQLRTYSDAAGQGSDLGALIAKHANRGLAAIGTAPPQTSPTPAPSSGPQANLTSLLNRTKKGKKNAATPAPAPTPIPSAPAAALINVPRPATVAPATVAVARTPVPAALASPTTAAAVASPAAAPATPAPKAVAAAPAADAYAILPIEGSADAALRDRATQRLLDGVHGERADSIRAACAAHVVHAIFSGTLVVRPDAQYGGGSATLDLTASDCSGKPLWHQSHTNDAGGAQGQQTAVDRAVDAAIGAYLNPPKRRGLFQRAGA